ncbi:hypothetical protein EV356DRAFT_507808 [Viridothelium virens]|uniref:Rab-GAP TBC domain-containing protein n=1 Tax=Viridothelium virens TaxID=1048519 RepID=A0A6A6GZJ9_VIRVR|nr:hypothetical protein EV356DRAFT_507808 [Viridothelium virens]
MASSPRLVTGERQAPVQDTEERQSISDEKGWPIPDGCLRDNSSMAESDKATEIGIACNQQDLRALRNLAATRGGLLIDSLRQKAWPLLLGVDQESTTAPQSSWESLPTHKDENQVKLDVDRAFVYYPSESDAQLSTRRTSLQTLITVVLRRHPYLSYFQGYHDIVQVFLLVFGSSPLNKPAKETKQPQISAECMACIERLSLLRIRDFLLPTLDGLNAHMSLLPSILEVADTELYVHIRQTHRSYSLSGILTLYAHEIQDYDVIARLFDFLLATDAVMSVYLFGAIILSRRDTVFEIESTDTDMLLHTLSKLPQPLDLEALIAHALHLYSQYPPLKLPHGAWRQISSNSVLKTCSYGHDGYRKIRGKARTRTTWQGENTSSIAKKKPRSSIPFEDQTLQDGEAYFHAQAAELKRAEAREKVRKKFFSLWIRYRKPARNLALFTTVAVFAYWLRSGTDLNMALMDILRNLRGMRTT